jgi:hypothetical protein
LNPLLSCRRSPAARAARFGDTGKDVLWHVGCRIPPRRTWILKKRGNWRRVGAALRKARGRGSTFYFRSAVNRSPKLLWIERLFPSTHTEKVSTGDTTNHGGHNGTVAFNRAVFHPPYSPHNVALSIPHVYGSQSGYVAAKKTAEATRVLPNWLHIGSTGRDPVIACYPLKGVYPDRLLDRRGPSQSGP